MAVERLGGWQDPRVDDGPRHWPLLGGREEAEEENVARLSLGESSFSQLVGLQVLPLRSSRPAERGWSDVSDEPVLRRRVSDVWYRRAQVPRVGPGGPRRPDDLRVPTDDQVHVLQVRRQRRGREARRCLHTAVERGQREDIRFPLVLVPFPRRPQLHHGFIQDRHYIFAADKGVPATTTVSSGQKRGGGDDRATEQSGRLVPPLHARREFGHGDIQGRDARAGEQTRLETSPQRAGDQGGATGSLIEIASESQRDERDPRSHEDGFYRNVAERTMQKT